MSMDKPPKKDDKSKSEENAKATSVLDNILGDDLGFGTDDLSLDLGLDLDTIIDRGLKGSSSPSSGLDDLFSSKPASTEAKATPQADSPAPPEAPESNDAQAPAVDIPDPDTIREVTPEASAETSETPEPAEAPTEVTASPAAEPAPADAPAAEAKAPEETPAPESPTEEAQDAAAPAATGAAAEASPSETTDEPPAQDAAAATPEAEAQAPADASQADVAVAATGDDAASDDAADTTDASDAGEPDAPAVAESPAEVAPADAAPPADAAKVDLSSDPAAVTTPGTVPTTIEITADEIVEDEEQKDEAPKDDAPKPTQVRLDLAGTGQKAHERTMELEEADEVLEELRSIHQQSIGGGAKPPPPPPKKGPPPPPPSHRKAAATPPPPPTAATPPPPPQATKDAEPLLRDPSSDAMGTLELDVADAVVAPTDPDDTPRIKAKALEEAPIQVDVPEDAPAAALPEPPSDLKQLLDVPAPNMPSPPDELQHDIDIPKAPLPPPPADLKAATATEDDGAPVEDSAQAASESPSSEGSDGANGAAAAGDTGAALFPDVDPAEPPAVLSAPQETASAPDKPAASDEEALADAFSDSMSELAAIASQPALPAASPPAEGNTKSTQLLGPDFAASLQQELHQMEPGPDSPATNETDNADPGIEFPPKEAGPPTSGTADFLDTDPAPAPASQAPQAAKKKPANPLMQTAMYGSEAVELQQQLIEAQKAAEAAENAKETAPNDASGKRQGEGFQTQLYTADDVAKAAISIGGGPADNRSTLESTPAADIDEEAKPGVKVQLDGNAQDFKSALPADSLFDVNMDSEIEARVAAKKHEAEAERAIQNNNFAAAIRIYHQLQQQFPQEAHFQEKLKQLVALEKKSKGTPAPVAPAARPAPNNAQAQPARPAMRSARKQPPPKQGLSTLNMVLAALVIILTLTLFTGLVWPGWLRGKSKPTSPEKPKTVAPLVR